MAPSLFNWGRGCGLALERDYLGATERGERWTNVSPIIDNKTNCPEGVARQAAAWLPLNNVVVVDMIYVGRAPNVGANNVWRECWREKLLHNRVLSEKWQLWEMAIIHVTQPRSAEQFSEKSSRESADWQFCQFVLLLLTLHIAMLTLRDLKNVLSCRGVITCPTI